MNVDALCVYIKMSMSFCNQFNFFGVLLNEFDIRTNMLTLFSFFSGEEMLMLSR